MFTFTASSFQSVANSSSCRYSPARVAGRSMTDTPDMTYSPLGVSRT
ncbi:hypothetical protein PAA26_02385 [Methanomassiliicoccaceae archaeon COG_1]|nr:hypothetical protein [Methanomassiliicoccaceae archaeon COG_1]